MVSNKLMVAAFATLASLVVVDAGPCRPSSTTAITTTSATETASSVSTTEKSTEISATVTESETTTTVTNSETTTTATESETSTTVTNSETTTAVSTTETSTTVSESATSTTTTADAGPTTLLINSNFDDGTTSPWIVTPKTDDPFSLSSDHFEGTNSGRLEFGIVPGFAYTNYFYQKVDKKLLKVGTYHLLGFTLVDYYSDNPGGDGCGTMRVACFMGAPANHQNVPGSVTLASADVAVGSWFPLDTVCTFTDEILAQYDEFGVAFGFNCANAGVNLDAVSFERST
ncbi:hypothetical protein FDECE_9521 [Fusarium decemcellulare]|nr:hypothetical protein FDECE_9521 [Fusarium decemcellulare]